MATTITAVQGDNIAPITLIDLDLNGNVYYISSNYKAITYNRTRCFLKYHRTKR
jgi:hypothetical protein